MRQGHRQDDLEALTTWGHSLGAWQQSVCSPTPDMLAQHGVMGPTKTKEIPTFALFDEGVHNLSSMTQCYLDFWNTTLDRLDDKVLPEDASHSTDVFLRGLLGNHARRVDPWKADLFFEGATLNNAWLAARLPGQPCGGQTGARKVAADLAGNQSWTNHAGRWVFIDTDWRVRYVFDDPLTNLMIEGNATLATADKTIARVQCNMTKAMVLPYKTHYFLEDAAFLDSQQQPAGSLYRMSLEALLEKRRQERPITMQVLARSEAPRDMSYTFHGKMNRHNAGKKRYLLVNLTETISNTSIQDDDFQKDPNITYTALDTAKTLLKSSFCLVAPGDTPSTRRLFDALAAGCVPVIFEDFKTIADNLPFRNTINWSSIAIFAGSFSCAQANMSAMQYWMELLVSQNEDVVRAVEVMREQGRRVYRTYLSYKSPQLVDAMLAEFNKNGTLEPAW